jgi:hypothetical protein
MLAQSSARQRGEPTMKTIPCLLGATVFFATTMPAFAGTAVPAPILGAGLPGLALLGLAGGGYLFMKWRGRKD